MPAITEANRLKNNKRNQAGRDQTPEQLIPNPTLKKAFENPTAHPPQPARRDGLKVDSKQSHHSGVPLDSFTSFTQGFTKKQIEYTRTALEKQGLLTGNHLLNSVDLWKRYHQGKSKGPYAGQGAHQRTNQQGIDGTKSKQRWESLSVKERFGQVDRFVSDMTTNRRIAQESDMNSRMLLGNKNTPDNDFGGNFSQRILNPRNPDNAAVNSANARAQRQLYMPSVPRALSSASTEMLKMGKGLLGKFSRWARSGAARQMTNRMAVGSGQMDEDLMTMSERLRIVPIEQYSMPDHLY
jgi:hypothetical protein